MVLLSEMAEGFDSPCTLTFSQQWAVEKPQFCFAVDTEIKSQLILIKYRLLWSYQELTSFILEESTDQSSLLHLQVFILASHPSYN